MKEKTQKEGKDPKKGGNDPKIHEPANKAGGGLSRPCTASLSWVWGASPAPMAFASSGCPSVSGYSSFGGATWVHGECVRV